MGGQKEIEAKAHLKCPECDFVQEVEIPKDACQFFFQCSNCKAMLKPKEGDCCVFCSYADVPCPPKQEKRISKNRGIEKG